MTLIQPLSAVPPQIIVDSAAPATDRTHRLRIDQVVQATVAEGGLERVLLQLKNHRFWAETHVPLKKGQSLHLLVQETNPKISLRILDDDLILRLRHAVRFLDLRWDIGGWLRVLRDDSHAKAGSAEEILAQMDSAIRDLHESPERLTGELLRRLRTLLGLAGNPASEGRSQEGSLKSILREYAGSFRGENRESPLPLLDVQGCMRMLQICQACLARDEVLLLPLPFPFLEQGYGLIEPSRKERENGGDGEESRLLTLFLRIAALGDLTIRLLRETRGLSVRFECETADCASFLSGFRHELEHALRDVPLRALSFSEGARSPHRALMERLLGEEASIFDARV